MPHSSYISKHLLLLLATLLFALPSFAQGKFAGRVTDAKTKEPLAFVNIIYNAKNQGTSTDLDGYFKIDDYSKIEFLRISYLGYTTKIVSKDELSGKHYIEL
ncbi:MAG: carboxypeptidase-like regulatory domain-containing protein, partial [Bacteroidales bacterium]|nr:carboxypeptidase-like regulatory domain-containing protein [Bacteroidales bacterium]